MNSWQITNIKEISKINLIENLDEVDSVKVKITRCFITQKDINAYLGIEKHEMPFIPGEFAVGQTTETLNDSSYFFKGQKVYVTTKDDKNNGFLKEFAVVSKNNCYVLPANVNEYDALFIKHISLALTVIDRLKIEKGEYVAIVGGSILGNIIAQLVTYYKAVPIIVDKSESNIEISQKTDIYYNLLVNKNLEKEIIDITGGRKCKKVIYVTDNDINFDTVLKLASNNAYLAVTGITDTTQKLNLSSAFDKNLNIKFIKEGYDNIGTAINLLVQKAVNLSFFKINDYKFEYVNKHFENAETKIKEDNKFEFTVNLL